MIEHGCACTQRLAATCPGIQDHELCSVGELMAVGVNSYELAALSVGSLSKRNVVQLGQPLRLTVLEHSVNRTYGQHMVCRALSRHGSNTLTTISHRW